MRTPGRVHPGSPLTPHDKLITFVKDRPGHDHRYAINASKAEGELEWKAAETFESGIRKTVQWYLAKFQREPPCGQRRLSKMGREAVRRERRLAG